MDSIPSAAFWDYWQRRRRGSARTAADREVSQKVLQVIDAVREEGDRAIRRFAAAFDKSSPESLETPTARIEEGYARLKKTEPALFSALEAASSHIRRFAEAQKNQLADFDYEIAPGLTAGQKVIPVERAGVYAPAGRFPLISSVLMGVIPAKAAGVPQVVLSSPPQEDGFPDWRILAAARLAGADQVFAIGGAQAIAAMALGTETVPQVDVLAGPGNRYVAEAKRLLFGEAGIDCAAGPTDVLIIAGDGADAELIAADMLAQAEHDPDARARALVPNTAMSEAVQERLNRRIRQAGPCCANARASLDAGGLIIVYDTIEEAARIANTVAPEHLELHTANPDDWIGRVRNYGSLFIGAAAPEALGDYSAGINHTLPTGGSARFAGGLSARHFLKAATTLKCAAGAGWEAALETAQVIARAEGLRAHEESAALRCRKEPGEKEKG
ncbi:MAG: histidinol dehydrogenase [Spirochaetaceae bacterium]|jgi:histidinol dehydrogenase|nr:histidinol dehydrogenase [Spirochaetaceae bacterium]